MRTGWRVLVLAGAAALLAGAWSAGPAAAQSSVVVLYADRPGTDIVMDAPWRTVRDYVPVMFFFPQFEGGREVESIRVFRCENGSPVGPALMVDHGALPDTLNGATFIGPMGEARAGITPDERIGNFWHYVVRIPVATLGSAGAPGYHDLWAEVAWSRKALRGRQLMRSHRVLRVLVQDAQFPSFGPEDRYFDTHNHTIAEQSAGSFFTANSAYKAYAGPIVMLLETAYALGLVQAQPRDGNWTAFRDSVAVTDHNIFYSTEPYDSGTLPGYGPTANLANGHSAEGAWYRANLGRLSGEEITLRRGSNQDNSPAPNIGHHLLAYDTRHFEGPWHGGLFLTSTLENPNTLEAVLSGMKAASPTGFVYASHPSLASFVWPPEYFAQAIGLPPYDSKRGPLVNSAGTEFLFKGSEVWNAKLDRIAKRSGWLASSVQFDALNPFEGGPAAQRFEPRAWDGELSQGLDTLFSQIGRGLRFAFRENPRERFIRKLYMSAGSDAHGDYNYTDEVTATAVPYSGAITDNAYARVRTCALASDRPAGTRDALDAFREGNTVITDGPLVMFSLDSDGRHDPEAGAARWHDAVTRWENADGRIGGAGTFDGGRTMLVAGPGRDAWVRSRWMKSATPGAGNIARLRFDRVMEASRDSFTLEAGPADAPQDRALPRAMERACALVASVRDPLVDERCITNPVWVVPVQVEIASIPAVDRAPGIAYRAGELEVSFHFPLSMSAEPGTRAFLRPLDSRGNSTDPEFELAPSPGWEEEDGVAFARYTAANAADIPEPPETWDAEAHAAAAGVRSFVVYLKSPTDVHGNRLNDIGRAFALPARRGAGSEGSKP